MTNNSVRALGGAALATAMAAGLSTAPAPSMAVTDTSAAPTVASAAAANDGSRQRKTPAATFSGAVKGNAAVRNSEQSANARPMWVQRPVLVRKGNRFALEASVSARAYRVTTGKKTTHRASKKDRLRLDVTVARQPIESTLSVSPLTPARATGARLLANAHAAKRATRHGVVEFSVPLRRSVGKRLKRMPQAKRAQRVALYIVHEKDTFPQTKGHDYVTVSAAKLAKKPLTARQTRKAIARNARQAKRSERGSGKASARRASVSAQGGDVSAQSLVQGSYNRLGVQNNTPFNQTVAINWNIACMNTTDVPTMTTEVVANTGSFDFFTTGGWFGSINGNPPSQTAIEQAIDALADNNAQALRAQYEGTQGLAAQARSKRVTAQDDTAEPSAGAEPKGEKPKSTKDSLGEVAGAVYTADHILKWVRKMMNKIWAATNDCKYFGQFWGLSSQVTGFPTDQSGQPVIQGTPQSWATVVADSTEGGTSHLITSPANAPGSLPTDPTQLSALTSVLNAALGGFTENVYFHNAGMPAPIASIPDQPQWAGFANWSQGLVQTVYPNPGECVNNDCSNDMATRVQLAYVLNGGESPAGPTLSELPTLTATTSPSSSGGGGTQVDLQCNLPTGGTFISPFGGVPGLPISGESVQLAGMTSQPSVTDVQYMVGFYALDDQGNYLTSASSQQIFPGSPSGDPTTSDLPAIGPNAGQQIVDGTAQTATAFLSPADLAAMVNPQTGSTTPPYSYGCAVTPFVGWQGMAINDPNSPWGANWPFPQVQTGGPLSPATPNTFDWPNAVNALNLSWSGQAFASEPVGGSTVTGIAPASGPAGGGTSVTITGTNFTPGSTVTIGGNPCTSPIVVSPTTITCVTPMSTTIGAADVEVGWAGSSTTGYGIYTYQAPNVTGISPSTGPINGGTPVTISGTGFLPPPNGQRPNITVAGVNCTNADYVNSTTLTCTTGAATTPEVGDVVVSTRGITSTGGQNLFGYGPANITSISPSSGPIAGGTAVTLTGANFLPGYTVSIGGVPCTEPTAVSLTSYTCTTGPGTDGGPADVTMTYPGGSAKLPNGFTYLVPSVTGISPDSGPVTGQTNVTISGSNFANGSTVTVGGVACTNPVVVSSKTITCTTGSVAHAGIPGEVVVTSAGTQVSGGDLFTSTALINGFTPLNSFVSGGATMTILGTGFAPDSTVMIGGKACSNPVVEGTTYVTCTIPANGGNSALRAKVTVTSPSPLSTTTADQPFSYNDRGSNTVVVNDLSGNVQPAAGGSELIVQSPDVMDGFTVSIGGSPCTLQSKTDGERYICTTPALPAGTYNVHISAPGFASATIFDGFTAY